MMANTFWFDLTSRQQSKKKGGTLVAEGAVIEYTVVTQQSRQSFSV